MTDPGIEPVIQKASFNSFSLIRSLLSVIFAVWVAACGNSLTVPPPPDAVRQQLETMLQSAIEPDMPGAVIQIVTPEWTWTSAAENAQIDPRIPAQANMRFRIASVSKVFTATAVLKLAEEGKLNLDDPIEKWLPRTYLDHMSSFAYHDITVRMLLNHRSTIPDYDELGVMVPLQMSHPTVPITTDFSIFQGLDQGPEPYTPGKGFHYSNPNFLLLTRIIDAASGTSYEDYVRGAIIDPLGLRDTFMTTDPLTSVMSEPYMRCISDDYGSWDDYSTIYLLWDRGSGDIVSTVEDLNTFHRALREGRIINTDSLRQMQTFLPAPKFNYGLGYMQRGFAGLSATAEGHNGGYVGAVTDMFYLPDKNTYIALNRNGTLNVTPLLTNIVSYLTQLQ